MEQNDDWLDEPFDIAITPEEIEAEINDGMDKEMIYVTPPLLIV